MVMPATSSVPAVAVLPVALDTLNTFDPTIKSPLAVKLAEFPTTCAQGLTLVHISAQRKRFLWDTG